MKRTGKFFMRATTQAIPSHPIQIWVKAFFDVKEAPDELRRKSMHCLEQQVGGVRNAFQQFKLGNTAQAPENMKNMKLHLEALGCVSDEITSRFSDKELTAEEKKIVSEALSEQAYILYQMSSAKNIPIIMKLVERALVLNSEDLQANKLVLELDLSYGKHQL